MERSFHKGERVDQGTHAALPPVTLLHERTVARQDQSSSVSPAGRSEGLALQS